MKSTGTRASATDATASRQNCMRMRPTSGLDTASYTPASSICVAGTFSPRRTCHGAAHLEGLEGEEAGARGAGRVERRAEEALVVVPPDDVRAVRARRLRPRGGASVRAYRRASRYMAHEAAGECKHRRRRRGVRSGSPSARHTLAKPLAMARLSGMQKDVLSLYRRRVLTAPVQYPLIC
jgi:hypothetical protein